MQLQDPDYSIWDKPIYVHADMKLMAEQMDKDGLVKEATEPEKPVSITVNFKPKESIAIDDIDEDGLKYPDLEFPYDKIAEGVLKNLADKACEGGLSPGLVVPAILALASAIPQQDIHVSGTKINQFVTLLSLTAAGKDTAIDRARRVLGMDQHTDLWSTYTPSGERSIGYLLGDTKTGRGSTIKITPGFRQHCIVTYELRETLKKSRGDTRRVAKLQSKLTFQLRSEFRVLAMPEAPDLPPGPHCTDPVTCEFYDHCNLPRPDDHVGYLPRIQASAVEELADMGVQSVLDIPDDFPLSERLRRACTSVQTGSHATRFAILGSPVLPTTVNTGKTSQLCLVGQTVVQYFVKPVDCVAGGEGGIRTLGTGVSPYNGLAKGSFLAALTRFQEFTSDSGPPSRTEGLSFGSYCAPLCAPPRCSATCSIRRRVNECYGDLSPINILRRNLRVSEGSSASLFRSALFHCSHAARQAD